MDTSKPPLEMRDSGISCFTPSPPPKKSSLPRSAGGNVKSMPKELRRRIPSRENLYRGATHSPEAFHQGQHVEVPPKLDLSGLTGDDSESDADSLGVVSSDRTFKSDEYSHPELALAVETPSTGGNSRTSTDGDMADGYQSDVECSSSSPGASSCSPSSVGHPNLRRYGSGELEEESEGSVLKVRLKLKSSRPRTGSGGATKGRAVQSGKGSSASPNNQNVDGHTMDGSALSKYAPLPGIGHQSANQNVTVTKEQLAPDQRELVSDSGDQNPAQSNKQHLDQEIREQRLKALEKAASQAKIMVGKKFPVPPPQSAKTVSRREMRMKQFARRKSASQAEAASRQGTRTSSQASDTSKSVLLAVRLPSGTRVQNLFSSSEPLETVAQFALTKGECPLAISSVCLITNDMPMRELTDLSKTIEEAELSDRTLLNLQEID